MGPLNIELTGAERGDLARLQVMATYYVYDISEFMDDEPGWAFPEAGLYAAPSFAAYFDDPDTNVFLIRVNGEIGGFAIVDTKGSTPEVQFNMAQFWVHRKFKGRGVGAFAAGACFSRFAGLWEVNVIPRNTAAFAFWRRIIHKIAVGSVEEARRPAPHLKGAIKDIFRFRTGET